MIAAAVVIGIGGNFLGVDPVKGLVYAAVLQGCLGPPSDRPPDDIARDEDVMGPHRNGWFDTTFGFIAAGVMAVAAITLVVVTIFG